MVKKLDVKNILTFFLNCFMNSKTVHLLYENIGYKNNFILIVPLNYFFNSDSMWSIYIIIKKFKIKKHF